MTISRHIQKPKIEKICLTCKKKFIVLWARRQRKYCSMDCSKNGLTGKKHWWTTKTIFKKGHRPSLETRLKMSKNRKGKGGLKGKLSPMWKGGKYKRYIHKCWTKSYKNWRDKIFRNNDYECQECGQVGGYLQAHHLKEWSDYPKERYLIRNGITLCKKCHKYVHWVSRLNSNL